MEYDYYDEYCELFDKMYGNGASFFLLDWYSSPTAPITAWLMDKLMEGGRSQGLYTDLTCPSNPSNLSDGECRALQLFLRDSWWRKLLKEGVADATTEIEKRRKLSMDFVGADCVAQLLSETLFKLPLYQGDVYRGLTLDDLELSVRSYPVGTPTIWSRFISASASVDLACAGNVLFIINGQHKSRMLGAYAPQPEEQEIVFAHRVVLDVCAVERRGDFLVIFVAEQKPLPVTMRISAKEMASEEMTPEYASWRADRGREQAWRAARAMVDQSLLDRGLRALGLRKDDLPTGTRFSRGTFSESAARARDAFFAHKAANPHVKSVEEMSPLERRMQSGTP